MPRRITRRLAAALWAAVSAVSLLLFVASVAVWVRSFWIGDEVSSFDATVDAHRCVEREYHFTLARGMLRCSVSTDDWPEESRHAAERRGDAALFNRKLTAWSWARNRDLDELEDDRVRWFKWTTTSRLQLEGMVTTSRVLRVPWWAVVALTAVLPCGRLLTVAFRRHRARGRGATKAESPGPLIIDARRAAVGLLRRGLQRVPAVLAGLSVLLFLSAVALWAYSYWVEVELHREMHRVAPYPYSFHTLNFRLARGTLVWDMSDTLHPEGSPRVDVIRRSGIDVNQLLPTWALWRERDPRHPARSIGPQFYRPVRWTTRSGDGAEGEWQTYWVFVLPWWAVVVVTGIYPAAWAVVARQRRRDRRRRELGLCRRCGYDLRASEGRCPECGEAVAKGAA